ncbi:hypothetical protein GCM10011396_56890 [Undibacterium terreum]|uniref:Uncharacterized protein n=1 Tax=Undibacterium terreum TaxID=1224302 RepID=A0A916XR31_9BURK|nr:hypothetical protein GCM10011396_56890 [Undibacterium terreum]
MLLVLGMLSLLQAVLSALLLPQDEQPLEQPPAGAEKYGDKAGALREIQPPRLARKDLGIQRQAR